jgi:hypothetical protein
VWRSVFPLTPSVTAAILLDGGSRGVGLPRSRAVDHAFYAVEASTDLRAHAADLRRRWDARFGRGRHADVRHVVADSWTRMLGAGLDPERLHPVAAADDDALDAARRASPLRQCLPDLRGSLASLADDAEHIMVVCDAAGTLLWIEGHDRVLEQARAIDFVPGMNWTERSAGTNAIGTALAIDQPVQIFSAEHFLPEQHPWWCSASPIHHPVTGELLGVVDLSGPQRTAHPYSLALVNAAVAIAERELLRHVERDTGQPAGRGTMARRDMRHGVGTMSDVWRHDPATAIARVQLLATQRPTIMWTGRQPQVLSLRQAEVIALLAVHDEGMTAEQLTLAIYGDDGNPVTTRALVSRLREGIGDVVSTRPYRLAPGVHVDLNVVRGLLARGDGDAALAAYRGPLLPASRVTAIEELRREVDLAVRGVAMSGGPDVVWQWLDTATGAHDLAAVERFVALSSPHDPRRGAALARREAIAATWRS